MFKIVPTNFTGIHTRFGKFKSLKTSGLNFKIPLVDEIYLVSNKIYQKDFDFHVPAKDGTVGISIAIQTCIKPELSAKAFYTLDNPDALMKSLIESEIRNNIPKKLLSKLLVSQEDIKSIINKRIAPEIYNYGYEIKNVLITDIRLPKDITDAMNRVNASQKIKEASINESEANYILDVKKAEADKERKRLQGEGTSLQRLAILSGYEESINKMTKDFNISSDKIIDFVLTTQHLDAISTIGLSNNSKIIFLNHEPLTRSSSLINNTLDTKNLQTNNLVDEIINNKEI